MTLRDLLLKNRSAIVGRWQRHALAVYASDASAFFSGEKDRFANPVGHGLRAGTEAIFDGLLNGAAPNEICAHLEEIVRVRAIQELAPSEALNFLFALKRAVRQEIGEEIAAKRLTAELTEMDAQIDQVALYGFDIYTKCRDKVSELRIKEIKRSVAAVMKRLGVEDGDQPAGLAGPNGNGDSRRRGRQ